MGGPVGLFRERRGSYFQAENPLETRGDRRIVGDLLSPSRKPASIGGVPMRFYNRACVLVENQYENLELWYPYWRLRELGLEVDLVGPEDEKVYGSKEGYSCTSDTPVVTALERDYDVIVVPGGMAPDKLRRYPNILQLVKKVHDEGGIVASICHGPWVLISAKILRGRKATCVSAIKDDVVNAGAEYHDVEVVVDRNIVTSRTPKDLAVWSSAIVKLLEARGMK